MQSQGEMSQVKHYRRVQPGDQPEHAGRRRDHQPAGRARDLPARVLGRHQQAHASSVMCSYSTINGQYACENDYLLHQTLDQRWTFPGFVTSDYGATHSTVASAEAGNDQEMPSAVYYGPALQAAVQAGQVSMATLNGMVSRILTELFRFNEFNNPPDRDDQRDRHHPGAPGHLGRRGRGGHGAAEEQRRHAAAEGGRRRIGRGDRPGRLGGADVHRRRQRVRHRAVPRHPAAGHPGRRRDRAPASRTRRACPPTRR